MKASLFSDLGTIIQGDELQLTGNDIGSPALASFLFKIFFAPSWLAYMIWTYVSIIKTMNAVRGSCSSDVDRRVHCCVEVSASPTGYQRGLPNRDLPKMIYSEAQLSVRGVSGPPASHPTGRIRNGPKSRNFGPIPDPKRTRWTQFWTHARSIVRTSWPCS